MRAAPLALAAMALAACEGGGDPVQQALRDASAERQAAAYAGYDETSGPAAQSTPASPAAADAARIAEMLAHHRAGLALAERTLAETGDPELRRLAQAAIDGHTREIEALEAWRPTPAGG